MLKPRVTGVIVVKAGLAVQSIGFRKYLPVGSPAVCAEFLNQWGIDEIVLLDLDATPAGREPDYALVEKVAAKCLVPLAVGGGVKSLDAMRSLIRGGADKIVVNSAAIDHPDLIRQGADVFGSQCMVVSIDARAKDGNWEVMAGGHRPLPVTPADWARRAEAAGAGEIFLNSVDRDGSRIGYDIALIRSVTAAVTVPVVACGGAGRGDHFPPVFTEGRASAAAAANFFHFTEHSVNVAKAAAAAAGTAIRGGLHAGYSGATFDADGRVAMKDEKILDRMRFQVHRKEVI